MSQRGKISFVHQILYKNSHELEKDVFLWKKCLFATLYFALSRFATVAMCDEQASNNLKLRKSDCLWPATNSNRPVNRSCNSESLSHWIVVNAITAAWTGSIMAPDLFHDWHLHLKSLVWASPRLLHHSWKKFSCLPGLLLPSPPTPLLRVSRTGSSFVTHWVQKQILNLATKEKIELSPGLTWRFSVSELAAQTTTEEMSSDYISSHWRSGSCGRNSTPAIHHQSYRLSGRAIPSLSNLRNWTRIWPQIPDRIPIFIKAEK